MKKICEVYDVSKDYDLQEHCLYVLVSDLDQPTLMKIFRSFDNHFPSLMTTESWQSFIGIDKNYTRNENKHKMREQRCSKRMKTELDFYYGNDSVSEVLENHELTNKIEKALSTLREPAKSRFLKHYGEHLTYREIAKEEGKAISTIYESIMSARKKFLKNFYKYPEQNTPNKCK